MINILTFVNLLVFTNGYNKNFNNFHIDPEIYMNVSDMITFYGYPCENHFVTTKDGYILSIQRISHGVEDIKIGKRPVVFLQHGLLDSSFTWVNNPPNQSLAFILADVGFDVWLANSRGNTYSNRHIKYSSTSNKFWDFSWDEMVKYDLSASIDYVLSFTNSLKLSYIGHSQGTEIMFAKLYDDYQMKQKISSFIALAPVVYLANVKTAVKYLVHVAGSLDILIQLFNHGEFLPSNDFMKDLAKIVCSNELTPVCTNLLFMFTGFDPKNLNNSRLPIYLSHTPAGTSAKNMVHYAQSYESKKFQMFDYGFLGNFLTYRQIYPPQYQLDTHGIPLAMFWGGNDWLADPEDVERAMRQLDITLKRFIPEYNHLDFIWGKDAAKKIYPEIIDFLNKYKY